MEGGKKNGTEKVTSMLELGEHVEMGKDGYGDGGNVTLGAKWSHGGSGDTVPHTWVTLWGCEQVIAIGVA